MRILFSLLVFSFVGGSFFSAEGSSKQSVNEKKRLRKLSEDAEVIAIFKLIREHNLESAEERLKDNTLVPDCTQVEYCEWEEVGPFRRRSFETCLGGKSYLWGTLALEYLRKRELIKATLAYNQMDEKFSPRSIRQVKKAINQFSLSK